MMRERPLLLVLDEPTSALDAHAEHELFERYAERARAVARAHRRRSRCSSRTASRLAAAARGNALWAARCAGPSRAPWPSAVMYLCTIASDCPAVISPREMSALLHSSRTVGCDAISLYIAAA